MFISKVWSYLRGYVIIKVRGSALEKFVNLANSRGIVFRDVKRAGSYLLVAKIDAGSFAALRPIAKRVGCRVEIESKIGLPFFFNKLMTRKMLAVGALIFVVTLYVLSSFVWFISIDGNVSIPAEEIMGLLGEMGVDRGASKSKIDLERLRFRIITEYPRIAWVKAEFAGTMLRIKIVEKVLPDEDLASRVDIVAAKDGLIVDIIPFTGEVLVKEGDTVLAGETLIKGFVRRITPDGRISGQFFREGPGDGESLPTATLREMGLEVVDAGGIVKARVWYEGSKTVPLVEEIATRTGRSKRIRSIKIGSLTISFPFGKIPYGDWEVEEDTKEYGIRGKDIILFTVLTKEYFEVEKSMKRISPEDARLEAERLARDEIGRVVPKEADIRSCDIELVESGEGDGRTVVARYMVETIESIGVEKRIPIEDDLRRF